MATIGTLKRKQIDDMIRALYISNVHYEGNPTWVVRGLITNMWCGAGCMSETQFRSVDGQIWHLHSGDERPQKVLAIPFKLFFMDEFNVD